MAADRVGEGVVERGHVGVAVRHRQRDRPGQRVPADQTVRLLGSAKIVERGGFQCQSPDVAGKARAGAGAGAQRRLGVVGFELRRGQIHRRLNLIGRQRQGPAVERHGSGWIVSLRLM